MKNDKIECIKNSVEEIKECMGELKTKAAAISNYIDAQEIIPPKAILELSAALEKYQEQEKRISDIGEELSLNFGSKLSEITASIRLFEENSNQNKLKEIIIDYFKLNTEAEDVKDALERSKEILISRCKTYGDNANGFEQFEIIIKSVKDKSNALSKADFKKISGDKAELFDIAFATDRGQLFIDNNINISKYSDNAFPLLDFSSLIKTENNSDISITNLMSEKRRWERYGGYLTQNVKIECADVSDNPTIKSIKDIEKRDSAILCTLWNIANEKLIPAEGEKRTDSPSMSKSAVDFLVANGFLVVLSCDENYCKEKFLVLSSKGVKCFTDNTIADFLKKTQYHLMVPVNSLIPVAAWTPLLFAQAECLQGYFRHIGKDYSLMIFENNEMVFAKSGDNTKEIFLPGVCMELEEEKYLNQIASEINSIGKNETIVIVVRQCEDIQIISKELEPLLNKANLPLFSVKGKDYAIFNSDGNEKENPAPCSSNEEAITREEINSKDTEQFVHVDTMLNAINEIKSGTASASKFKNDVLLQNPYLTEI